MVAKSLLDIAPEDIFPDLVKVGRAEIAVYGISALGVAALLKRFPELGELMGGQVDGAAADKLMAIAPAAVTAIIAAGTGAPGNAEAEAKAEKLPVGAQLDLLAKVLQLSFPEGVDSFVAKLTALGGQLKGAAPEQLEQRAGATATTAPATP